MYKLHSRVPTITQYDNDLIKNFRLCSLFLLQFLKSCRPMRRIDFLAFDKEINVNFILMFPEKFFRYRLVSCNVFPFDFVLMLFDKLFGQFLSCSYIRPIDLIFKIENKFFRKFLTRRQNFPVAPLEF